MGYTEHVPEKLGCVVMSTARRLKAVGHAVEGMHKSLVFNEGGRNALGREPSCVSCALIA
jgi:hypothetical protein